MVWGFKNGTGTIAGKCAGTELGINPFALLAKFKANSNGDMNKTFYVPSIGANHAKLQVLDKASCTVSPVFHVILTND